MYELSWVFVFLSILGNIFVVKKMVIGQVLWAISNIGWIIFDIYIGAYPQACLFFVYLCFCIWAMISWSKK